MNEDINEMREIFHGVIQSINSKDKDVIEEFRDGYVQSMADPNLFQDITPDGAFPDRMLVDGERNVILFCVLDKRMDNNPYFPKVRSRLAEVYDLRKKIYVRPAQFMGVSLLDYDAFIVSFSVFDEKKISRDHAIDLVREVSEEPAYLEVMELSQVKNPQYIITGLHRMFSKTEYDERFKETLREHSGRRRKHPGNPGLLCWSDDCGFEALLAEVNR